MTQQHDPSSRRLAGTSRALDVLRGVRRNLRNSARNYLTREQFWNGVRSLAWIAPLSVLIWVYAEREQIRDPERQTIPITVRTSDPNQVVTILRPVGDVSILADIQGPQRAIEELKAKLSRPSDGGAIITLPSNALGERDVTTSLIRESDLIRNSGVKISNETPQTLLVRVDKLVTAELEVRTPEGMENFNAAPQYTPAQVRVTLPETLMNNLKAEGTLVAIAGLSQFEKTRQPGAHVLPDVPVTILGLKESQPPLIEPPRVTASVDVRNAERQITLNALPIWPLYPPGLQNRYRARLAQEFIQNVVITGPRDEIDRIEAGTFEPRPKAIVEIFPEDVGAGRQTRGLRFDFPASVKVQDANAKSTAFDLVPIDGAPAAPLP